MSSVIRSKTYNLIVSYGWLSVGVSIERVKRKEEAVGGHTVLLTERNDCSKAEHHECQQLKW